MRCYQGVFLCVLAAALDAAAAQDDALGVALEDAETLACLAQEQDDCGLSLRQLRGVALQPIPFSGEKALETGSGATVRAPTPTSAPTPAPPLEGGADNNEAIVEQIEKVEDYINHHGQNGASLMAQAEEEELGKAAPEPESELEAKSKAEPKASGESIGDQIAAVNKYIEGLGMKTDKTSLTEVRKVGLDAAADGDPSTPIYEVVHEWVQLDYDWSPAAREEAISSGTFIPENNCLTGLKLCTPEVSANCKEDLMFGTVPRWAPGVPATLNRIIVGSDGRSVLQPWPSAEAQDPMDCSKIQYVQSMEIDPEGVMWVVDVGRKYFAKPPAGGPDNSCPPKILLIDIATKKILQTDFLPDEVAPYDSSFLNDIVLDVPRQVAYISDTGGNASAVVVYDRANKRFRRFCDESTTPAPGNDGANITIHGTPYPQLRGFGTDGIALSADAETLYYAHLGGFSLHSLSTALLRDFTVPLEKLSASVVRQGDLASDPDGMTLGADGSLFYGGATGDSLFRWPTAGGESVEKGTVVVAHSPKDMWWIDTFAWDNRGNLWLTSNKLNTWFFGPPMDFKGEDPNFRIIKVPVGTNGYMCGQKGVKC